MTKGVGRDSAVISEREGTCRCEAVGHAERACVLGPPGCVSPSLFASLPFSVTISPCLPVVVTPARASHSFSLSLPLSPSPFPSRSNRGASIPRPGVSPALRAARGRAAFVLGQPEGKLIPRCSDGNATRRAGCVVDNEASRRRDDGEKEENDEKASEKEERPAR